MSGKDMTDMKDGVRRRSLLKSIGITGATISVGARAIGTAEAAGNCHLRDNSVNHSPEDYDWKRSNSSHNVNNSNLEYDRLTQLQTGLVHQASTYVSDVDKWLHFFRSFGAVYTKRKHGYEDKSAYSPIGMTKYQKLKITNDQPNSASLYTTQNKNDTGVAPAPNRGDDLKDSLNFGAAAWTVALAALGTNPYVGGAIAIGQAVGALFGDNHHSIDNNSVTFKWPYEFQYGPCECVHYSNYTFHSVNGESLADFHTTQTGTYSGHGGVQDRYDVYVDPVPGGLQATQGSTISSRSSETLITDPPSPGTEEYTSFLEKSDFVERVPQEQIMNQQIEKLSNGGPLYKAVNPYSEVSVSSRSLSPKDT